MVVLYNGRWAMWINFFGGSMKRYGLGLFQLLLIVGFIAVSPAVLGQPEEFSGATEALEAADQYMGPKIVVNVAARHLRLYDEQDQLVKTYQIAVGMGRHPTPIGPRKMTNLVWNPWWIPPKTSAWAKNARDTPPGPNNPLGPVKMKLGGPILFHGTNKPKSIGHAKSHGCMRMLSEQAKELAGWIQQRVNNNRTSDAVTYSEFQEKVQAKKRRSFHVKIENPIPVDVVYEFAEVFDGKLNIYRDVYWRVRDKMKSIKTALTNAGYKPEKFDLEFIEQQMKAAKNKEDVILDLALILKKNKHLRKEYGKKVALTESN